MAEKMFDKKEDERENLSKNKPTVVPFLPSYFKSYSQMQIKSTVFDYTWVINEFHKLFQVVNTLYSPAFPNTNQCKIMMSRTDLNKTQFYICSHTAFIGTCTMTVKAVTSQTSKTSGHFSDSTLLIEISDSTFSSSNMTVTVYCKLEIYHEFINNTVHMNLSSLSLEDSTLNGFQNDENINFILGTEQYVLPKKLLLATKSKYFKNICEGYAIKIDMTIILTSDELQNFKTLLSIIIGSRSVSESDDYDWLKKMLITADKYDVLSLKLTCEYYLLRCITIKNAMDLVELVFSFNIKYLETHLANFVKFHKKEIMNSENFRKLPQKDFDKITELIEKNKTTTIQSTDPLLPR